MACPPAQTKRWTERSIPETVELAFAEMVGRLFALQPMCGPDSTLVPVVMQLTPEAKRCWCDWYNRHAEELSQLTGPLAATFSKIEETAARLALVIHIVRQTANDETADPHCVDAESMQAGIELAKWFRAEQRRCYGVLAESDEQRDQRRLVEWMARKRGPVTAREVQQGCRWLRAAGAAEAALDQLAKAGCGAWRNTPATLSGGRPSRVFELSTSPAVYETQENHGENEGSVDVDSLDAPEIDPLDAANGELLAVADDQWGEI